jgi:hypothetical protein
MREQTQAMLDERRRIVDETYVVTGRMPASTRSSSSRRTRNSTVPPPPPGA